MFEQKKADYGAVALLIALPLVLFADVFFLGTGFYWRDLITYHWPMRTVIREALLSGSIPYWNPFHLNGQPMAANPAYEIFYPPQLLILLPDFAYGFQMLLMFHLLLGLIGMYAFIRSLRVCVAAAAFGAIAFGFGGLFLSMLNLNPFFFSVAWLPVVFYMFRKTVLLGTRRHFLGTVGGLAMILLITEPASVLQTGLFLLGYILYRTLEQGERDRLVARLIVLASVCVLGAAVAAVQLIPAVDFAGDTKRALGFPRDFALTWSFPPLRLLELFFSNFFGPGVSDGVHYWGSRFYGATGPFYKSIYAGGLTAILAVAWLAARGRGALTFLIAAPVSFVITIGGWSIAGDLLYRAGLFQMIRYPEKWITLIVVPLPIFAALAFDRLLEGDRRIRRVATAIASVLLVSVAASFILLNFEGGAKAFVEYFQLRGPDVPADVANAKQAALVNVVFTGLSCALLFRALRIGRRLLTGAAMLMLAADLGSLIDGLAPRMPRSYFDPPRIAEEAHAMVEYPRLWHLNPESDMLTDDFYITLRSDQKWAIRNVMEGALSEASFIRTVITRDVDATSLVPSALFDDAVRILEARLGRRAEAIVASVARTNLRTQLVPFAQALPAGREVQDIRPAALVRTGNHPPIYFASEVREAREPIDAVRYILHGAIRENVAAAPLPEQKFHGDARVLGYRSSWNRYEIETVVDENSLLVVAMTPHRYWKAFVDGKETAVVPVNLISTGVQVAAGTGRVELQYRNPLVRTGATVSAGSLVITALASLLFARRYSSAPSAHASGNARDVSEHRE